MVTFVQGHFPASDSQALDGEPILHQRVYPDSEGHDQNGVEAGSGGADTSGNTVSFNSVQGCPPIAIVGMALRLPGGVKSPDELWQFLIEKRNGVCEVPGTRYTVILFTVRPWPVV